ncbi:Bacterial regulatory protein, gntR family [Posidoniimonas polymericola]|uniref:Bacterial regulatory protein, gntR family n=1 Tax=Posidoniimonas polymericola TaxID=2528002 RepID=A0A5C5YR68_9BACT|nr:substrate-binding domain-containing protein [Posidoniimonas polymericola]TWT77250.1 Bacterial regulatory protein, gntR family [Posidoniimonas polymericola]
MAAPAKYNEVMSVIKRRISEGDYLVDSIPGERRLAEETGVSYMTARRAVRQLLDDEVLIRDESGALEVHPTYTKRIKPAEVVLLYPAYPSSYLTQLRVAVSEFATRRTINLRPTQFVHWDEKLVYDNVSQAKGTIIIPHGPPIPSRLLHHFNAHKVVILDGDFSTKGLPSVRLFSDDCIVAVLDHLRGLGHRRLDCLNTQNRNLEIERRIEIWRRWKERHSIEGELHDDPAPVATDPTIVAYRLMSRLLDQRQVEATAFIGTTCPAAIGAIRACYERGLAVGSDLSIAAVNLEPPAEFFCPSITGLNTPELTGVLAKCFDWFAGTSSWRGRMLLEPSGSALFAGESAGAPSVAFAGSHGSR